MGDVLKFLRPSQNILTLKPFLDQVPNKGFALLAAGQFETRLQELAILFNMASVDFVLM